MSTRPEDITKVQAMEKKPQRPVEAISLDRTHYKVKDFINVYNDKLMALEKKDRNGLQSLKQSHRDTAYYIYELYAKQYNTDRKDIYKLKQDVKLNSGVILTCPRIQSNGAALKSGLKQFDYQTIDAHLARLEEAEVLWMKRCEIAHHKIRRKGQSHIILTLRPDLLVFHKENKAAKTRKALQKYPIVNFMKQELRLFEPEYQSKGELFFHYPFGKEVMEEEEPTFRVNPDKNVWYDDKMHRGGGLCELVEMLLEEKLLKN